MTARAPGPRPCGFPPVNAGAWAPRLARDIRPLHAAPGTRADARARPGVRLRDRHDDARERACDHDRRGTPRCTRAASSSRTARARTSCGTRCIDDTSAERRPPTTRWINIPPPRPTPLRGGVDQYPAARWIRLRPPLKRLRRRAAGAARHARSHRADAPQARVKAARPAATTAGLALPYLTSFTITAVTWFRSASNAGRSRRT